MKHITRMLLCIIVITTAVFTALLPAGVMATTTYFNTKSSDGYLYAGGINANAMTSWNTAHDAANATSVTATSNESYARVNGILSGGSYISEVRRGGLLFDTSSLPDTAIVSAASIQLYVINKWANMKADSDIHLQCSNALILPSDPIVIGDFLYTSYPNDCGSLALSGITANQYNTWTLNATGIGAISNTSITRYMVMEEWFDIADNILSYGIGDYNYQGISYYNYEAGSSYYPVLNITYSIPAAPTIVATSASAIADTTATLNGSITDDGGYPAGVSVKWGYGTTSQTAANFASYDTVDANFAGAYSTGETPTKNVAGLTTGITYYFRFQAKNTTGTTTSNEITFTTLSVPTITAKEASSVSQTTAKLNGQINNFGGEACQVRWGYGTTTQAAVDFESYDTVTAWAGAYITGDLPYLDVGTLIAATPYYYRFQAKNSIGTTTSGEIDFTTETSVGTPSSLIGVPTATTIKLTWSIGVGSSQYLVRVKAGSFPTTTVDGTQVYYGTALTASVTGLTPGQTYYYSVWGESGGTYSASYATCMVTTNAGSTTTSTGVTISAPWRWMSAPDYTNLSNLPVVYDAVNGVADTILMPRATFWMLLAMVTSAFFGIMAYVGSGQSGRGQQSQAVGMIVGLVLLTLWYAVKIVPFYIIALDLLWVILSFRAKKEMD
jgi:hypothetical protein